MSPLTIHPELQALIPPLTDEELRDLTRKLQQEGCQEALVVWQETQTLVDGHNRLAICERYELPYTTREMSFPDLDAAKVWMLENQLARRNLTPEQMSYLRGKKRGVVGQPHGGNRKSSAKTLHLKTDVQLAKEHKVTATTIRNDASYAKNVDVIAAVIPEAKQALLARDAKLGRHEVKQLASIARANPQTAQHIVYTVRAAKTPKAAKKIVRDALKDLPKPESKPLPNPETPALMLQLTIQETTPKAGLETIKAADGREMFILHKPDSKSVFNKTNEMVDWASWTWNPVTGCWHGCDYCYAREIANDTRMIEAYPKQFEPTFHPTRLDAPKNTPFPKELTRPADKNVFTCSMADLFGKWVPQPWILEVFARVRCHPEWNFLFLTKFPQRLLEICDALGGFPVNAWVGCTVDGQARVATAERAFQQIEATVRWLSVEPMRERLTFQNLAIFDWLVMGGQTQSYFNNTPAFQPPWEWVEHLWQQARVAGVKIYWKENLTIRPKEVPWEASTDSSA